MKYYAVKHSCEPAIIGVNNIGPVLEAREYVSGQHTWNTGKKYSEMTQHPFSFPSKEAEQYYVDYYNPEHKLRAISSPKRLYFDNFEPFDTVKCREVLLYKTRKRVKETDWMDAKVMNTYCILANNVFSERFLSLLKQFCLPSMNIISARVEGFDTKYALVDFACISPENVDFKSSVFLDDFENKKVHFMDHKDYQEKHKFERPYHIILRKNYPFDVLKVGVHLYFSEPLLQAVQQAEITALSILKFSLEC